MAPAIIATPAATAGATPSAEPTFTEEEVQEGLELIRAQPRRDGEDPYAVGEVDAPVVLIEYADYRCSFCGKWALETKPGLMEQVEDGTLRIAAGERLLLEQPGVKSVKPGATALRVRFAGDEAQAARLLATLVGQGQPVCGFSATTADLEDAFLSVTQGRLQ